MHPAWQAVRRLLVARLDNMGDVLLTGPAIEALAEALPGVSITLLCGPAGAGAGALLPAVDHLVVYEAPWVDPWRQIAHDRERELRAIEQVRGQRFDAAVIFTSYRQSSLPAAYFCYLAGIPLRLGYSFDASGSLLTTRLRPGTESVHEVERNLALVQEIGVAGQPRNLAVQIPEAGREAIDRWLEATDLSGRRPLIVVHPGCSMPARTYPAERYATVIELLVKELDAHVVLTGTDSERPTAEFILDRLSRDTRRSVRSRVGNWPLDHLAGLLERADLVITNNTGPMHLAAATGTPSVVLFALTNPPDQWKPWRAPHRLLYEDVPCRHCYSRTCPLGHHQCLTGVAPATVVESAHALLTAVAVS